jgi:hypothetical protein
MEREAVTRVEEERGETPLKVSSYFTALFNLLPTLNFATLVAGIRISLPVLGFRPFRALLFTMENVPKPVNVILSPFFKAFVTVDAKPFNTLSAAVLVIFESLAIAPIKSALVM